MTMPPTSPLTLQTGPMAVWPRTVARSRAWLFMPRAHGPMRIAPGRTTAWSSRKMGPSLASMMDPGMAEAVGLMRTVWSPMTVTPAGASVPGREVRMARSAASASSRKPITSHGRSIMIDSASPVACTPSGRAKPPAMNASAASAVRWAATT